MYTHLTLEQKKVAFDKSIFEGKIYHAILSVKNLPKPCHISVVNTEIKRIRKTISKENRHEFDQRVAEGLKDYLKKYFI